MTRIRTNYKIRDLDIGTQTIQGSRFALGAFDSLFVKFSDLADIALTYSWENPMTVSMGGYGKPWWLGVVGESLPQICYSIPKNFWATNSYSGSIGWIYGYTSDTGFSGTHNVQVLALIGSR